MPLNCDLPGANLAAAIRRAATATPRGTTVPILANLLITGRGDSLEVAGSDLDQSVTVTLEGVAAEGAVTAPAATLAAIAQRCADEAPVTLEERGGQLHVKRGRAAWRLPCLPPGEYPGNVTQPIEGTLWQPPAAALCAPLKALAGAIDPDNPRAYLQGVYFDFDANGNPPHFVATETHKLGAVNVAAFGPPEGTPPFILPYEAVRAIAEFEDAEGALDIVINPSAVTVEGRSGGLAVRYWTKLIDGAYPKWRAVFPAEFPRRVRVPAAGLADALNSIGAVDGDLVQQGKQKVRIMTVRLDFADGELTAAVGNSAGEGASDSTSAIIEEGGPGHLFVNGAYLDWAVNSLPRAGDLLLGCGDQQPLVVTHADDTNALDRRLVNTMRG